MGHSFGGYNQLVFQRRYPSTVVGMVLGDSSHPDQINRLDKSFAPENYVTKLRVAAAAAYLGIPRHFGLCRDDYTFPNAPSAWIAVAPRVIAVDCRTPVLAIELQGRVIVSRKRSRSRQNEVVRQLPTRRSLPRSEDRSRLPASTGYESRTSMDTDVGRTSSSINQ